MFVSPTGKIRVSAFTAIRRIDGTLLVEGTDYDVASIEDRTGVITGLRTATMNGTHAFKIAEAVTVTEADFPRINSVEIVGLNNKIAFTNGLEGDTGDSLTVSTDLVDVTFKDITEGWYFLEGGEEGNSLIVVRGSFASPYVSYSSIKGALKNGRNLSLADLISTNSVALEDVFSELSVYGNYYDFLIDAQIATLVRWRVLVLLANDYSAEKSEQFRAEYLRYVKQFTASAQKRFKENETTGEKEDPVNVEKIRLTIEL